MIRGREWSADRALARRTWAPVFPPAGEISTAKGHGADAAAQLHARIPDRNHGTGLQHLLRGRSAPQAGRSSHRSQRLPAGRLA
ncbi:hypothetical protein NDU88_002470 [Pleurodeles waltl]|uniref:Uncharacterized protein n=1 Tax=Pleurodeles waltl TaxID=8319 RepID=A0AAV7SEU4_PLEWA|nr:hypothetical protein NDU88_002470 [Pleurodeles waltl]